MVLLGIPSLPISHFITTSYGCIGLLTSDLILSVVQYLYLYLLEINGLANDLVVFRQFFASW